MAQLLSLLRRWWFNWHWRRCRRCLVGSGIIVILMLVVVEMVGIGIVLWWQGHLWVDDGRVVFVIVLLSSP